MPVTKITVELFANDSGDPAWRVIVPTIDVANDPHGDRTWSISAEHLSKDPESTRANLERELRTMWEEAMGCGARRAFENLHALQVDMSNVRSTL